MSLSIRMNGIIIELEGEWDEQIPEEPGFFHFNPKNNEMLSINGCCFHIEAIEVKDDEDGIQEPVHEHNTDILDGLWRVDNVKFETIDIDGRECVMYILPAER